MAEAKSASVSRVNPLDMLVWEGTDKRGAKMKGEAQGKNVNLVKADLRRQGINPTVARKKPKPLFGKAGKTISAREIATFSRQIATMMQSGVPLVTGMDIVAGGQKNPRMGALLADIRDQLAGGTAFSEALSKHPLQFDDLFQNLVQAGEGDRKSTRLNSSH